MQYKYFSGVIKFDTTLQAEPVVELMVKDEQLETFEWISSEFVRMMGGKRPMTVLTGKEKCIGMFMARKTSDFNY